MGQIDQYTYAICESPPFHSVGNNSKHKRPITILVYIAFYKLNRKCIPIVSLLTCNCMYTKELKKSKILSQWVSCQIRKLEGCACARNAGNVFHGFPDMHHGSCVTYAPWSLTLGFFEDGGGENVPGIPDTCATHNFTYLVTSLSLHFICRGDMYWGSKLFLSASLGQLQSLHTGWQNIMKMFGSAFYDHHAFCGIFWRAIRSNRKCKDYVYGKCEYMSTR